MIFFVSGSTGGHIYPGISLAQYLRAPSLFIFPKSFPAEELVRPYGFNTLIFKMNKWRWIFFPIMILKILVLMFRKRPKLLIAAGGEICVPFSYVAWLLRIPIISLEQNSLPGRATRAIQWIASHIITSFDNTDAWLKCKSKVTCLGNPIRVKFTTSGQLPKIVNDISGKVLLIIGGSQGAKGINEFIFNHRQVFLENGWSILHLTGKLFYESVIMKESQLSNGYCMVGENNYYVPINYFENMATLYQRSDIVLCRSGATTLAELRQVNIPAILVPFPYAKDDHQFKNAQAFKQVQKESRIIHEHVLNTQIIISIMDELFKQKSEKNELKSCRATESICRLAKTYLQ